MRFPLLPLTVVVALLLAGCTNPVTPPDDDLPVWFIHGLASQAEVAGRDSLEWQPMLDAMADWGWDADELHVVGYYACDSNESFHVEGYGKPGDDPHAGHIQRPGWEHNATTCGGGHDADTTVEHLGYHLAWALHERLDGDCAHMVVHSMGGLVARYALARSIEGHSDFPPAPCIRGVVAMGTPHIGSDWANEAWCQPYECHQLRDGSPLMQWLHENAQTPRPRADTRWMLLGSEADGLVHLPSQMGTVADVQLFVHADLLDPLHHGEYWVRTSEASDAPVTWRTAGGTSEWAPDGFWPVRAVHEFLSGGRPHPSSGISNHAPGVREATPPTGAFAIAAGERVTFEVECESDPEGHWTFVTATINGVPREIDQDLPGFSPSMTFRFEPGTHQVQLACQDGLDVGGVAAWTVNAS
ncbi:MAG: esterase/lipase family protein [Thermoplasmatota archaeon]